MSSSTFTTAFDWNLYNNRTNALNHYRQTRDYMDALLETKDGTAIPVHTVVVWGLSEEITKHMSMQTAGDPADVQTSKGTIFVKRIRFSDMKGETLKALVDCAYTGQLQTDMTRVWDVLEVAERFAMKEVIGSCCVFLSRKVNLANSGEMYRLGKRHRHSELIDASLLSMRRNIEDVVKHGLFFRTIDVKDLKSMLSADDLGTTREEFVWEAIKTWIMADCDGRQVSINYLLAALRFHRTSNTFLRSLLVDPLIKLEKRRGRSQTDVIKMWHEKTSSKFPLDGRGLPAGLEPYSVKPRIPNAILFGIGGWKGGRTTNLIETYDKTTNLWVEVKSDRNTGPNHAYFGHEWLDGRIYMFGGTDGRNIKSSVISFDPTSRDWMTHKSMASKRCYVATAVLNGFVYAIGGHNGDHRLSTVEKYDLLTDEWTGVADMNVVRSDAGCAIVDGKIYAVGGLNENSIEASIECYDPVTDKWTMMQEMGTTRTSLAVVGIEGMIYALGGNRGDSRLSSCEKYNPVTNTWTPITRMIDKRSTFSACVLDNKIVVTCGYDGSQPFNRCESYDTVTDTWTAVRPLKNPRSGLALVKVAGIRNGAEYTFCGNQKTSLQR